MNIVRKPVFLPIVRHLKMRDAKQADDVQYLRRREGDPKISRLFHCPNTADQSQHDEAVGSIHEAAKRIPNNSFFVHMASKSDRILFRHSSAFIRAASAFVLSLF